MIRHPGGEAHTRQLLAQACFPPEARVLDMGAGDGSAVRLMRRMGLQAEGIDLMPDGDLVAKGNFLHTDFPGESFDGVLTQCAFYVSKDVSAAFGECARLLKTGGLLLFSDVWFAGEEKLRRMLCKNGFRILSLEDESAAWKEYYIEAIWRGEMPALPSGNGKCRYYSLVAEKSAQENSRDAMNVVR